jgi:putative FmdB family regulatory protein
MPTYDYACTECEHTFEEFHGMKDRVQKCPECGKESLTRIPGGGGGILFKGAGFYKTDYRKQKYIEDKQYDNRQARKAERLASR